MSKVITINGVEYIPRSEVNTQMAVDTGGLQYVVVRADRGETDIRPTRF